MTTINDSISQPLLSSVIATADANDRSTTAVTSVNDISLSYDDVNNRHPRVASVGAGTLDVSHLDHAPTAVQTRSRYDSSLLSSRSEHGSLSHVLSNDRSAAFYRPVNDGSLNADNVDRVSSHSHTHHARDDDDRPISRDPSNAMLTYGDTSLSASNFESRSASFSQYSQQPLDADNPLCSNGDDAAAPTTYELSKYRWWIVFVFCLIAFNQSLIWVTYSPITSSTKTYYNISTSQVDLLLNWGPIINLPLLGVTAMIASTTRGLRMLVRGSAWLGLAACVLRLIPVWFAPTSDAPDWSIYFLHFGQILNAAAGPTLQATVARFSAVWVGSNERRVATALLFVSNNLGSAAGFLMGPGIVQGNPDNIPKYLYAQLGLALLAIVFATIYLPQCPPSPPSAAAATMASLARSSNAPGFVQSVLAAFRHPSFIMLALSSGAVQGAFNSWTSILSTLLPYSESQCGWLSFSASIGGVLAGLAVGPLAQHVYWRRSLKSILVFLMLTNLALILWFMLSTSSIFAVAPVVPGMNLTLVGVALTLAGIAIGASAPLAFELGVELTYPLYESVSSGCISGINNAAGLIFLFAAPALSGSQMTAVMAAFSIACTLLLFPMNEQYLRMDAEAAEAAGATNTRMDGDDDYDGTSKSASTYDNNDGDSQSRDYASLTDASSDPRRLSSMPPTQQTIRRTIEARKEFMRAMAEVDEGLNEAHVENRTQQLFRHGDEQ